MRTDRWFLVRRWLAVQLRALARWCDPTPGLVLTVPMDALYLRASVLTQDAEASSAPGTSGEWKRQHCYARLQREFPGRPKREIARVIEAVL